MLLGALNFAVLGQAITGGGLRSVWRNSEVRGFLRLGSRAPECRSAWR